MPQSLQCPRCQGAVTVNDRDAGGRVRCPHCGNTFVVPAVASVVNDDDDWLRLDDDIAAPPPRADADVDSDADISTDVRPQDFLGVEESVPKADDDDELFGDLPPMEMPTLQPPPKRVPTEFVGDAFPDLGPPIKKAAAAESIQHQTEFRLNCPVCGSLMYAKASQEGKTIKCSDCYSQVLVPPPPKVKQSAKIDIDNAQTFEFEEPPKNARREDPFRKSAADLLQDAEQAGPEIKAEDYQVPSILEWARKVFGIFTDLNVMVRWIVFSAMGALPAYFALSMNHPIATLGLFVGGALFSALLISCGFAILQSVANDEPTVEDWPSWDPMEWLGSAWIAFAAAGFAGVPALVLSQFVFDNPLIIVAVTMFSIYTMFPFVLLSMLDMQTAMMPFSPEVARSVTTSQESWGGFYFSAGLLFFGVFLLFVGTSGMAPPTAAIINVAAIVGLVFTYFAMIGRLAFAIGQSVNEPPRKHEMEEGRKKSEED